MARRNESADTKKQGICPFLRVTCDAVLCYTEKATEARHRLERQHACADHKKQCRPNERKPNSKRSSIGAFGYGTTTSSIDGITWIFVESELQKLTQR